MTFMLTLEGTRMKVVSVGMTVMLTLEGTAINVVSAGMTCMLTLEGTTKEDKKILALDN